MKLPFSIIFVFASIFSTLCGGQINFIHVPKTGGSTIKLFLKEQFPEAKICSKKGTVRLMGDLENKKTSIPRAMRKILNHHPNLFTEIINSDITMGHFPYFLLAEKGLCS